MVAEPLQNIGFYHSFSLVFNNNNTYSYLVTMVFVVNTRLLLVKPPVVICKTIEYLCRGTTAEIRGSQNKY